MTATLTASVADFRVLGPLTVTAEGDELKLGGPKQRLVLAMLLAANGQNVSAGSLMDGLWGDRTTVFEVGGRNIFDEEPDALWYLSGIETFVHDPRGGTWYLRVTQDI